MLELTGCTNDDGPVVKATSASRAAAASPAVRPSWRKTAQTAMVRHDPVMRSDTSGMASGAPSTRISSAIR